VLRHGGVRLSHSGRRERAPPLDRRGCHLDGLGTLNAGLAVGETLAHLEVLAARGMLVAADGHAGVRYFTAA
jgi:hypothetical protein